MLQLGMEHHSPATTDRRRVNSVARLLVSTIRKAVPRSSSAALPDSPVNTHRRRPDRATQDKANPASPVDSARPLQDSPDIRDRLVSPDNPDSKALPVSLVSPVTDSPRPDSSAVLANTHPHHRSLGLVHSLVRLALMGALDSMVESQLLKEDLVATEPRLHLEDQLRSQARRLLEDHRAVILPLRKLEDQVPITRAQRLQASTLPARHLDNRDSSVDRHQHSTPQAPNPDRPQPRADHHLPHITPPDTSPMPASK